MESIEENNVNIEETIEEKPIIEDGQYTTSLTKPKKPRTEKQIEALKKAQETRRINIEKRKQEKQDVKKTQPTKQLPNFYYEDSTNSGDGGLIEQLSKEEIAYLRKLAVSDSRNNNITKPKPKKKQVIYHESSSEEEEIIYIPKSKKKKKKKVIVHQSSSSESSSEEDQEDIKQDTYQQKPLRYSDVFRFQ